MNKKEFQHTEDLLWIVTDNKGTVIHYNHAFHLLVCNDIQNSVLQYVHPEDIRSFKRILKNTAEKQKSNIFDVRLKFNNSGYKWFETKVSVSNDATINITFYLIDKRKKEVIQLKDALSKEKYLSQMKSKFVSTTSHEIRTPLSIIKSSAEVMMMFLETINDEKLSKSFMNYLVNINNESDRLSRLINDVLIMQKADMDMIECNKQSTDILSLISHTIERHNLIQKDGRIMNLIIKGAPSNVMIDPTLFEYIMDNLFSNAFKYSQNSNNPDCLISYSSVGFNVSVKDYGIGIPEEDINQIFNLFYRANNAKLIKGTGLGLNIVKKLVELQNGTVLVKSQLNKETEFIISFPHNS